MQGLPLLSSRRNVFLHVLLAIAIPLFLLLTVFNRNVSEQKTYVIKDGNQVVLHRSDVSDPAMVLEAVGIKADPHEYRVVQCKEHMYEIRVVRDDTVVVVNCGEKMYVAVSDSTVGALLERAGVPTGEGYEVSCDLDAEVVDGMTITVNYLLADNEKNASAEPLINNGVAVFPNGEVLNCYEMESF